MIRARPCPACGTDIYADWPRWVHDAEQRLARLTDRHQPQPYSVDGQRYCNACGDLHPCADARILAGMDPEATEATWTR